jgi:hypothetical protein
MTPAGEKVMEWAGLKFLFSYGLNDLSVLLPFRQLV